MRRGVRSAYRLSCAAEELEGRRRRKMDGSAMRQRMLEMQIRQIEDERFPSVAMMNQVEGAIQTREQLEEYAQILLEKFESTRFPSLAMCNRMEAIAAKLE